MKGLIVSALVVTTVFFAHVPVAQAGSVSGVSLGSSTGGVLFTADNGNLLVDVGGCLPGGTGCTPGNVTGNVSLMGSSGTYTLNASSSSFVAFNQSTGNWCMGCFSFTGNTVGFDVNFTSGALAGNSFSGTLAFTTLAEDPVSGIDTIGGTATSGGTTTAFSFNLGTLNCSGLPNGQKCTLINLTNDPPSGFASIGSGAFGNTSGSGATPEPGTLLLLGSGLLGLAAFVRTRFGS